jgi:hypothetical protein
MLSPFFCWSTFCLRSPPGWAYIQAKGQCYDHYFARILSIFGKKANLLKNIVISFWHKIVVFWIKIAFFSSTYFRRSFLNHSIGPRVVRRLGNIQSDFISLCIIPLKRHCQRTRERHLSLSLFVFIYWWSLFCYIPTYLNSLQTLHITWTNKMC